METTTEALKRSQTTAMAAYPTTGTFMHYLSPAMENIF